MKKFVVAFLGLFLGAFVHAQSSVSIYGVVDVFGQYLNADGSVHRLQGGGLAGSRIGFRGREDLGGGYETFFVLEGGINVDEGTLAQGGAMFGRQSVVGLRGPFGSVSAGRQYSSIYAATVDYSVFTSSNAGPSTALIGGFAGGYEPVRGAAVSSTANGGPARVNNSLRYDTPSFGGFKGSVLYGMGETPSAAGRSRLVDFGLRYTNGGLDLLGSFLQDEIRTAGGVFTTKASISTLAGAYGFGQWRVMGGYLDFSDKRPAAQDGKGAWVGAEYRAGKFLWKAQYVLNKPDTIPDARSKAYGVGVAYELSKRTALYGSLTHFKNDGNTGAGGLGRFNATIPGGLTTVGNNDISELVVGVRHSF